jgi:hypothetical protein
LSVSNVGPASNSSTPTPRYAPYSFGRALRSRPLNRQTKFFTIPFAELYAACMSFF